MQSVLAWCKGQRQEKAWCLDAPLPQQYPQRSPYACMTFNLGPRTVCRSHRDYMNFAAGWCAVTALGFYDYKKGGQIVFEELKLIVDFPPGSTMFLPSALLTHFNLAVDGEERRFSIVRYIAGGLFMWVASGFRTQKQFKADDPLGKAQFDAEANVRAGLYACYFPTKEQVDKLRTVRGYC